MKIILASAVIAAVSFGIAHQQTETFEVQRIDGFKVGDRSYIRTNVGTYLDDSNLIARTRNGYHYNITVKGVHLPWVGFEKQITDAKFIKKSVYVDRPSTLRKAARLVAKYAKFEDVMNLVEDN